MYVEPYTNVALEQGVAIETLHRSDADGVHDVSDNYSQASVGQPVLQAEVNTEMVQGSLSIGDFAAVQFQRTLRKKTEVVIYMAAILDIDQDSVVLKFMEKKAMVPPLYRWPDIERSFTHPKKDVICTVTPPEVEYKNRSAVYTFREADVQKIQGYLPGQQLIFK